MSSERSVFLGAEVAIESSCSAVDTMSAWKLVINFNDSSSFLRMNSKVWSSIFLYT